MKRTMLQAMALATIFIMIGCGADDATKTRSAGGFSMGYITVRTEQAGTSTLDFQANQPTDLSTIAIHVMGVEGEAIIAGLDKAPSDLYLTQTNEAVDSPVPSNALQNDRLATTFYIAGTLPSAGKYKMSVVVRHIANCLAKTSDKTRCKDGRFLGAINRDYDVAIPVTLNVMGQPITPINSRPAGYTDPNIGQPTSQMPQAPRTGGLFSVFR